MKGNDFFLVQGQDYDQQNFEWNLYERTLILVNCWTYLKRLVSYMPYCEQFFIKEMNLVYNQFRCIFFRHELRLSGCAQANIQC